MRRLSRRDVMKVSASAGAAMALGRMPALAQDQPPRLSVLTLTQPDPVPPGVGNFAADLMANWQTQNNLGVDYRSQPFFEIGPETEAAFGSGTYLHDIFYNWATIPQYTANLLELGSRLPSDLIADLALSQAASVSWQGKQYGVVPTLSLMVLFCNKEIFQAAGILSPPATWDDLKATAANFASDNPSGLHMPYAAAAGIGGVASVWMAFLQQAGGRLYDDNGKPVFDNDAGVDALQFMIDLMPITTVNSLTTVGYADTAYGMTLGNAAMTFSFPAFWSVLNNGAAPGEGKIVPALMPKGPENNATINGVDAWTIATTSPSPDQATQLIEFYLSPEVQKRQAIDTGWLPSRLSVLGDTDVQAANPVAAVLLEQAKTPFNSFVTPNYMPITDAIGREIQKALRGEQTASQALTTAKATIQPLIIW